MLHRCKKRSDIFLKCYCTFYINGALGKKTFVGKSGTMLEKLFWLMNSNLKNFPFLTCQTVMAHLEGGAPGNRKTPP